MIYIGNKENILGMKILERMMQMGEGRRWLFSNFSLVAIAQQCEFIYGHSQPNVYNVYEVY